MTRTLKNGQTAEFTPAKMSPCGARIEVAIDGKRVAEGQIIKMQGTYPYAIRDSYSRNEYAMTAAEHEQLMAEINAAFPPTPKVERSAEYLAARAARADVSRMYDAAERKADWPEQCCKLRIKADQALTAWREKYPVEAAQIEAEEKAAAEQRKAEREADFNSSFIGRGLD
jgi:hypothetical protein